MQNRLHKFASYLFIISLLFTFCRIGFAKSKIDGDWEGALLNGKLPMIFHIQTSDGSSVDSPTQSIHGMPMFVTLTGKTVRMSMLGGVATFEGTLEGSRIVGTFSQVGTNYPMTLTKSSKKHNKQ